MLRFYVLLLPLFTAYGDVLYADLGENVTLNCFYTSSAKHLSWYKQVPGEPPQIISSFYKSLADSNIFHKQFKDSKRLSVSTGDGFYNLKISNVQSSDSALYYCSFTLITVTEFAKGTFLLLKNSSCRSFLHQPDSVSVQQGDSVTLNCSMLTGSINGEHSVYWFRKTSRGSHLGTLYTTSSGGKCVRSPESSSLMHSCVYSLPKRNVSVSDAGTYHCAVASCGQILFGEGTRLNVEELDTVLLHGGVAALTVSLILNIILISILCQNSRRKNKHSEGSHQQPEHVADTQDWVETRERQQEPWEQVENCEPLPDSVGQSKTRKKTGGSDIDTSTGCGEETESTTGRTALELTGGCRRFLW
ncbi:uncharacterized protein LOC105915689 [Fundulus heteroclitus]|uniref:uncharacterized protein LOC105915689 n=1 Tax=Fundulus heteroclitus TaxID=8078 RepID=UPI00165B44D8|nr:uncharacterized protein LOC105915689 [Fundulus heteroclitus]